MYVVATLGSLGDLHPFLAIARALHERGDEVIFLSQEAHRAEVQAQGLQFEAIASQRDHDRTLGHPDLWHPIRGFGVLWRHLVVPAIEPTVAQLERLSKTHSGAFKVLASPLVVGARLFYDLAPYELTTAHTAPAGLRSSQDPMYLGSWQVPPWSPQCLRQALWSALDRYKLEPMAAPVLNTWRRRRGLPAIEGPIFAGWLHSPRRTLALFPSDFGPGATDWPVPVIHTGFPRYLATAALAPDPELDKFLVRKPELPLFIVYPGSAPTRQLQRLTDIAGDVARSDCRCLLIGGASIDLAKLDTRSSPGRLMVRHRVNLPNVLDSGWLFLHHGGIGAVAHGLAADVPQVIDPSAYDQFDNAWRLIRMDNRNSRLASKPSIPELLKLARPPAAQREPSFERLDQYSLPSQPNLAVRHVLSALSAL